MYNMPRPHRKPAFCPMLLLAAAMLLAAPWHCGVAQVLQRRDNGLPEYVLGAGDQVVLHVGEMEEISDKPIRIGPDGHIDLPLIGSVPAAGLTLAQLRAELVTRLSRYLKTPDVAVNITDNQSHPVSVFGAVNKAGVYQLAKPTRLLEVISLAGGVSADAGPNVVVTRESRWGLVQAPGLRTEQSTGYSAVTISLSDLTSARNPATDIVVLPNDVVSVPRAELVYVVGNVRKAGGFTLSSHESMTVLQAVSLAEGFSPNAAGKHARILRKPAEGTGPPREIPVDAERILKGQAEDVPLIANDILYIPNSGFKEGSKRALEVAIGVTSGIAIYRR